MGHRSRSLSPEGDGRLNARTDEDALKFAASIRIILTEFAERVAQVLEDKSEVDSALNFLLTSTT